MNKKVTLENPYTIIDATCYIDRPKVFDTMEAALREFLGRIG